VVQKRADAIPQTSVSLSQIEGVKLASNKRSAFEVMSQGAVHAFAAESEREAQQWADALLRARAKLQATAAPSPVSMTPAPLSRAPSLLSQSGTMPLDSSGHLMVPPSRMGGSGSPGHGFGRIMSSDGMSQLSSSQASWSGNSSSTDSRHSPSTGATQPRQPLPTASSRMLTTL
jgi:hypothetical protein